MMDQWWFSDGPGCAVQPLPLRCAAPPAALCSPSRCAVQRVAICTGCKLQPLNRVNPITIGRSRAPAGGSVDCQPSGSLKKPESALHSHTIDTAFFRNRINSRPAISRIIRKVCKA